METKHTPEICNCPICGEEHDRAVTQRTWALAAEAERYCSAYCYTQSLMKRKGAKHTPDALELISALEEIDRIMDGAAKDRRRPTEAELEAIHTLTLAALKRAGR